MKHPTPSKPYSEMTTAELRVATKEFDRPFIIDTFRPMTPAERARWNRVKRNRGRPRVGEGAEVVSVSIERGLLSKADKLAKKLKVSRAKLIAHGLENLLARVPKAKPSAKARRKAA